MGEEITTNIVTPLNINRGEINRIRNRRFLVEKPTFESTLRGAHSKNGMN